MGTRQNINKSYNLVRENLFPLKEIYFICTYGGFA
jgi:hypothetical protein